MKKVRFVSNVPNLSICYTDYVQHPVSGVPMEVTRSVYFKYGVLETADEKIIEAIRNSKSFNVVCFEVLSEKEEEKRNTGMPKITSGAQGTVEAEQSKEKKAEKPDYIQEDNIQKENEEKPKKRGRKKSK